jgi:hypothetical protein
VPDLFSSLSPPRTTTRRCLSFDPSPLDNLLAVSFHEREARDYGVPSGLPPIRRRSLDVSAASVRIGSMFASAKKRSTRLIDRSCLSIQLTWNIRDDGRRRKRRRTKTVNLLKFLDEDEEILPG